MLRVVALFCLYLQKIIKRIKIYFYRRLFLKYGRNSNFDPKDLFSYETISVGNDVYIGPGAKFSASKSSIVIGDKVMFGPGVTIMGGDHNTSEVGRYMYDVKEKRPEDDAPVVIETDCWIGANATILKGVTIGRGSIVAAGSVVTRSMPEYSIIGGIPAKVLKPRFSPLDLEKHKSIVGK